MGPIYVLDDEPVIRYVISEALHDAGYITRDTACGAEVLRWLQEGKVPAAIVLDLLMPGMSGREFLQRLRENPAWADTPVVLVTGAVYADDTFPPEDSYQALVLKPFDLRELVCAVRNTLDDACFGRGGGRGVREPSGNSKIS